ncbi:MAG: hypothetical protein U0V48_08910 [Anaerolineales bacterium]
MKEVKGRKVIIEEWIVANGIITVRGRVIAVQIPVAGGRIAERKVVITEKDGW